MREFLEIEKQNELIQQKELEIANASRVDRQKVITKSIFQNYLLNVPFF